MRRILPLLVLVSLGFAPAPLPKKRAGRLLAGDLAAMQGTWRRVWAEHGGTNRHITNLNDTVVIKGDRITYGVGENGALTWTLELGEGSPYRAFDTRCGQEPQRGIYELKGDTLRICYSAGGPRPGSLVPGEGQVLDSLERVRR